MYTITVTNLNDSGTGTLREAIAFANSYTGNDEIQIVFDESLTGKTIYLESDLPVVSTDCAIIGNGVSWSEYSLSTTASVELTDLEFPQLILTGIASVSSQNVILTSQDAIRLEAWSSGFADFSGIVTTADNAYAVVDSWVGDLNNLVLPELPECMEGGYRINVPVTNLNDEGSGSLRAAILLANSYIGEGEIHIIIDELLAGQSMSLTYELPTITRPCHIEAPAEGISISSGLYIGAETYLRNLSASQVVLTASGSLKAENVTLTAREAIRLVDWGGKTDFSGIRATAQNAYVLLYGNLYDATLTTLPESFAGGYQCGDYYNGGSLYIAQGSTVTLEDGVAVKITASNGLYVSGTLKAEYEESASAIFSNSSYDPGCLYIENGGKVLLTNANIKDVDVYVRDGSFQMNGGSFEGYDYEMWGERAGRLTINSSSMATLSNVEVSVPIVNDGGYLEMDNINSTSSIEINGESLLDDVTCTQLIVNDGSVTTSEGKKVYLASYIPFVFGNAFDGAISDFLSSFDWEITSTQARVYLRQCDLGKVVLSELPEQLSSGYVGSVVLSEGETANLNDKDMKSVDVENNGSLTLSRCQTNNVSNNGSLTLEDVSVSGCVISKGTLVMEDSEVSSYIRLHGNASLDGVSCTQLQVYNGSSVSSGEKGVTLTLGDAFTIAPDFVGNIGEWLNSFKWSVTSDEARVYLNGCDLSKLALTRLPEPLKGGYDGYVYVYDDDELQLSNQFWTCLVYNYGKLVVKDAEIGQVANGGMLELENVKVDGHITSRISKWDDLYYEYTTYFGKLNLKNVVISDYVGVAEEACLDNVVCSYLEVGDSSAVCIGEHGIRLTGGTLYSSGEDGTWPMAEDVAFVLTSSFEGDIAEWLNSFEWEVDNADAGIYLSNCDLSKVTLSTLPESLSGGYHGSVTVPAGKEISLYDIESSSLYINNDGSLTLENSIIHSVDNSCYVSMIGGKIARNHSENEYISGAGNVSNSGTMTLEDVSVEAYSVSNSGTMTLENVSVEAYTISNSGTMSITDCDVDTRNIYLYNNSELFAENVVFGDVSVYIYSSSTRIVGSDLSRASIKIMGTPGDESLIDLSGNYWGTTDLTEIWAKIDGDKSRVVIDDIMLASPPRVFTLTKESTDWLKIADTAGQLTLNFNREVDAGSVSMESLGLCREDGSVVSIKEYIVEGKSVTLIFDTLSIGQYFLQVTNDLKDANGNAFSMPSGFESGISYEVYDSSANVPPRLLLVIPNSTLMEKFSYVDLFFNQAMDTDSMTVDKVHVFSSSGEEIKVTSCYETETSGRTCYRMEFDAVTEQGLYTLSVDSSVCNMFGVEMSASFEQQIYVGNPDIQPTDEISITSSAIGRNTVITYTVKNESNTEAIGPWMDSFYLCKTPQWNADEAVLLGRVLHAGSLPADGGIESTMNTLMQGIVPGDYYLFVRTDESDRVNEFDEENNLSAIGTHIRVWADELKLGAHTVEKLDSLNEWYVYQYTAERNETLKLGIDCENATIAIRDSDGNVLSDTPNRSSAGRSVCYFETNAGETYTIQVKGKELREHQMELKEVPLSLWSASSVKLVAGVKNSVVLSGCCFESDMQVYLQDEDGNRYDAASVQVDSSFQARLELELPETLEIGSKLTLHVGTGESEVAQLDTPLVISTYANMTLKFENMDGWSHTNRVGYVWRTHLLADNETAGDVRNAIILVTDSAEDFAMFYNYEEANTRDRSGLLFLAGEDAQSPGILHNGERTKMDIFVRNYRSGTGEIRAFILDPADESEIAPRRWEQLGSALRPVAVNDADWAAWWGNMQPRIGTTVSDFANFIYEMQGLVAMDGGKRSQCLPDLVAQVMENHPEYGPSAGASGCLTDDVGKGIADAIVELYRITDGEREHVRSQLTGAYGHFCFGQLEIGAQYELVCSEEFMHEGNQVNAVTFVQEGLMTEHQWTTPPAASVKIQISGVEGQLPEEAAVYLKAVDGSMVQLTRKNGAWTADRVLLGEYTLSAVIEGYSFTGKTVTVADDDSKNTFELSASKVVTVQGRLLNAEGSEGVGGVLVAMCRDGNVVCTVETDSNGCFKMPNVAMGDYTLHLNNANGRVLKMVSLMQELVSVPDIVLDQGYSIKGTLLGAAQGSSVELYAGEECVYETTLGPDATFAFTGVAEGEYRLLVNNEEIDSDCRVTVGIGEGEIELPSMIAFRGYHLNGQVSDMQAEFVSIYKEGELIASTQVAENGSFGFVLAEAGVYTLQAFNTLNGGMSEVSVVELSGSYQPVSINLVAASGELNIRVTIPLLEDSLCSLTELKGGESKLVALLKGDAILNTITNLSAGKYCLLVRSGNHYSETTVEINSNHCAEVILDDWKELGSLTAKLSDELCQNLGDGARLHVYKGNTFVSSSSLTLEQPLTIDGLVPGTYTVLVVAENGESSDELEIFIQPGKVTDITVSPKPMSDRIIGRIIGVDDAFVTNTIVSYVDATGRLFAEGKVQQDGSYSIYVPENTTGGILLFSNYVTGQIAFSEVNGNLVMPDVLVPCVEEEQVIEKNDYVKMELYTGASQLGPGNLDVMQSLTRMTGLHARIYDFAEKALVSFDISSKCCDTTQLALFVKMQNYAWDAAVAQYQLTNKKRIDAISVASKVFFSTLGMAAAALAAVPIAAPLGLAGAIITTATDLIVDYVDQGGGSGDSLLQKTYDFVNNFNSLFKGTLEVFKDKKQREIITQVNSQIVEIVSTLKVMDSIRLRRGAYSNLSVEEAVMRYASSQSKVCTDMGRLQATLIANPSLNNIIDANIIHKIDILNRLNSTSTVGASFDLDASCQQNQFIADLTNCSNRLSSWIKCLDVLEKILIIVEAWDAGKIIADYVKSIDDLETSVENLENSIRAAESARSNLQACIDTKGDDCEKDPDDKLPHEDFQSFDPNDIYGPEGYGAQKWIGRKEMRFEVVCENIPEENIAHAAMVTIKQKIDAAYDYSTFRLGDMMIAGNYIEVTGDVQHFQERVDWTETLGVLVDVNAFFDADTGEVTWEFVAIDPETGWVVGDPFMGLLAPNYNPPEGDGGVTYYVTPKETAESGTVMQAEAEIIFDFNEPIDTPLIKYTLDVDNPLATVESVAEAGTAGYLLVRWSGSDVGSGIKAYDVYVSVDGGEWQLWQEGISQQSALYAKTAGEHSYSFYAQSVDHVGNAEASAAGAEASLRSSWSSAFSTLAVQGVESQRAGNMLTLSIRFSEKAICPDWSAALQLSVAGQEIDLGQGTFRYEEATHTLTWQGSVPEIPTGATASVQLKNGAVKDAAGRFFGTPAPTYAAAVELAGVAGTTYAAPTLVDYNKDGLVDVLVGEVAADGKGRVRIYLNSGTAEVGAFAGYTYASTAQDTPLTLEASGCQGAIVRLADLTGDGADEMIIGLADGTVRVYKSAAGGNWEDAGELTCQEGGESAAVHAGSRAALEFVDANGDGRSDMLVGTGDGNVLLYLNTAVSGATVFGTGSYLHDAEGRIAVGSRASVTAGDFDGDGLWDMMVGSSDGRILFYRNEGTSAEALFGRAEVINAGGKPLDMSEETNRLRLDSGDLNGDGIDDLVIGQSDGKVKVLYGSESMCQLGAVEITEKATDIISSSREVQLSAITGGECTSVDRVYDWVGGNDAEDYFHITAAAEGSYRVSVDEETLEAAVMVSVGFVDAGGSFSTQQELILAPGAALDELPGVHLNQGETLYVKVEALGSVEDAAFYELNVAGSVPSGVSGRVTLDNSADKATAAVADGRSISGWVGAGDACDYYRVTLKDSGSLSMALDELESSARLRFFRQREDGSLAQLDSRIVKGGSELERTLSLTAGTYYVEVASADGGLGCCNTTYRLTLEEEAKQRRDSSSSSPLASM